jgi:hypothetical protein
MTKTTETIYEESLVVADMEMDLRGQAEFYDLQPQEILGRLAVATLYGLGKKIHYDGYYLKLTKTVDCNTLDYGGAVYKEGESQPFDWLLPQDGTELCLIFRFYVKSKVAERIHDHGIGAAEAKWKDTYNA